jgi:methyl coenzyme M reductase gamma subunit
MTRNRVDISDLQIEANAEMEEWKRLTAPMSYLEKRAAQYVDRIYGAPPEPYAKAIRDVKRMRADGVRPGTAMRKAAEKHGHTREQMAQAILDMRGAQASKEYRHGQK